MSTDNVISLADAAKRKRDREFAEATAIYREHSRKFDEMLAEFNKTRTL